jgi:capsular exopolysaccharide synthesis family protein
VTPREYIDVARERWRSILAGLLVGLTAAVAAVYLVPRQYAAPVTTIVSAQPTGDPTTVSSSDSDEISRQRLDAYIELLNSRRLARDVISTLQLGTTPEELGDRIAVTTVPESVLLTATVTSRSPDQAVQIANAVADQFVKAVAELEQPTDRTRLPAVAAKVFQAAELPAEQVAPRPVLYLTLGAVLGLVIGLAAAFLRHALDSRVKTRRELDEILGAPVLGMIGRDPKIASSPLVMYGAPHTALAEAFRQLRTNVQFTDVDREHKVILVTSATDGEGRSTTVCNLGLALAEAGTSVVIVDADLRKPAIARCLGVDGTIGLTDVLVNRVPPERALQPIAPALDLLPSGLLPPNPSELLGSNRMVELISKLRAGYDVVLIDTPPLLPVTDAAVLAPRADGVLLLVRQGRTTVQDVQAAKDSLHAVSGRIIGSVLTMAPLSGKKARNRAGRRNGWRPKAAPYPAAGRAASSAARSTPGPPTAPLPTAGATARGEGVRRERSVFGQAPHDGVRKNTWPPSPVPRASESTGQALDGESSPLIR